MMMCNKNWRWGLWIFILSMTQAPLIFSYEVEYKGTKSTHEVNQTSKSSCLFPSPFLFSTHRKEYRKDRHEPFIKLNFTATTLANSPLFDFTLPNINGAAGPQQYLLLTNNHFRSFDKKTGQPDGILNTNPSSFFDNFTNGDICLQYDRFANVWYVLAVNLNVNRNGAQQIILAVSDASTITPHTQWSFYQISPSSAIEFNTFFNFPQLAVDAKSIFFSVNTSSNSLIARGTQTFVVNKSTLLAGNPQVMIFSQILPGSPLEETQEFVPPANNFDSHPHYGYLCHVAVNREITLLHPNFPILPMDYHQFYLYRIVNPGKEKTYLTDPLAISVPTYASPTNVPHKGNVYGAEGFLNNFGFLNSPHIRNHQLYACHSVLVDQTGVSSTEGDRCGIRWYQFDLTGDPTGQGKGRETENTLPILVQYGTIFDPNPITSASQSYYLPAIMTNQELDIAIGMTVSGENDYINVAISTRNKKDLPGIFRPPLLVTTNTNQTFNGGTLNGQNWGLASSIALDVNNFDIWYAGEWAAIQNGYGVQVTDISFKKR